MRYTRKEVINSQYYEKFKEFSQAIETFFDNIDQHKKQLEQFIGYKFRMFQLNENPKTNFAWVYVPMQASDPIAYLQYKME